MSATNGVAPPGFRHEALLYAGAGDFVDRAAPLVAGALQAGEAVVVAVDAAKIALLRERLGTASGGVAWKDIRGIGANPARIIPLWRRFVKSHGSGRRLWGIGEPVWAGRTPAELVEAQRHEELLNLAFADAPRFTLLCPYDTDSLDPAVLREAHRSHPVVDGRGGRRTGAGCLGHEGLSISRLAALPEPASEPAQLDLDGVSGAGLHGFVADQAAAAGLDPARTDDLTVAIAAVARGMGRPGEHGRLRLWREPEAVLAEVAGLAGVDDPLAGREWPPPSEGPARGLWLANQLCDLVQVRTADCGAVVRLRVAR